MVSGFCCCWSNASLRSESDFFFGLFCSQDILKDAMENNINSATELPYFEGDFWPNVLEESIKELDQEEEEKRKREEAEAEAAAAEQEIGEIEGEIDTNPVSDHYVLKSI